MSDGTRESPKQGRYKVIGRQLDVDNDLTFLYADRQKLIFIRDNHFWNNIILLYSHRQLESAVYRCKNPGISNFWTAGKTSQKDFFEYWASAVFNVSIFEFDYEGGVISERDWEKEQFREVVETVQDDPSRLCRLQKGLLEETGMLPTKLPFKFTIGIPS